MSKRLLLKPTEDDISWWISHFVPEFVLWWWDDSPIPNEPRALRVLDRSDCRNDPVIGGIVYVNAFHTWAMHESVQRIIVDDGSWIGSLTDDERERASMMQVRLVRGLCIPQHRVGVNVSIPERALFDGRVALDQSLWNTLSDRSKQSVIEFELADWDRDTTYCIPDNAPDHVAEIANSFVLQEGVNCLSVTAYAIAADRNDLRQWMFPDTYSAVLAEAGYEKTDESTPLKDDVIVFRSEEGTIVHAAYVIQSDRILNKSGQTSFNPVAIVDLTELIADWSAYEFALFRR